MLTGESAAKPRRGKPAARLEPLEGVASRGLAEDPFLSIRRRATRSPKGKTHHEDIDRILYGRR